MYKIVIALMFLLFLTGAVEEDQNNNGSNASGGCATAGGTVVHANLPDSQMTPSYFEGGAQGIEDRK